MIKLLSQPEKKRGIMPRRAMLYFFYKYKNNIFPPFLVKSRGKTNQGTLQISLKDVYNFIYLCVNTNFN